MSQEELYKQLYHKMFNANEDAIRTLEKAQQECEELYLQATENEPETDDDME